MKSAALECVEVHARQGSDPPMRMQSPSPSSADDEALPNKADVAKQAEQFRTSRWHVWNRKFGHSISTFWNTARAAWFTGHCLTRFERYRCVSGTGRLEYGSYRHGRSRGRARLL